MAQEEGDENALVLLPGVDGVFELAERHRQLRLESDRPVLLSSSSVVSL